MIGTIFVATVLIVQVNYDNQFRSRTLGQTVALAKALLTEPAIILGNDSTGNLDTKNAGSLIELPRKLNKKRRMTVVVITHDSEVANEGDRIISIREGKTQQDKKVRPPSDAKSLWPV